MSLFLPDDVLGVRRALAAPGGPLAPLADSLARDLAPVLARPVWLPPEKAQLTRAGGVCPCDGARLEFDPFAPRAHRCPACGTVYDRDADYRWWVMGYQLWLAERAVHAAALALVAPRGALGGDAGAFAARVLDAQADAYLAYPNADNVLGPTRPFFSTYLESLWLTHVCAALDLLCSAEPSAHDALAARVCERVVEPSRALVAGFPEGRSNRQVWHAVARLAAARVLGDAPGAHDAVHGPHGIADLLGAALLADGSWYEGENYHQFAHRGFWYALRLADRAGIEVDAGLVDRFRAGYAVPFRVALPDDTLPARRDAQYAVSLRQWRWAEWCELGLTDGAPAQLGAALARLYAPADPPLPHRTGRWRATGESERNEPASALSRADLGWKSLLFARAELPPVGADAAPRAELLADQGYAILRRDAGRVYAALDYGGGGGGHGHPDRLNVILQDGAARWLDDPGTGTYVERALHWYRSTLAHAAPLVDGASQDDGSGTLLGFDPEPNGDAGTPFSGVAARARVRGVLASRALVAGDAYVVDLFTWRAPRLCVVDLPFPVNGTVERPSFRWVPFEARGAGGLEDGFDFVRGAEAVATGPRPVRLTLRAPGPPADSRAALWLHAPDTTLWRAVAPGPPGTGERRFHAVRMHDTAGAVAAVWDFVGSISDVRIGARGAIEVHFADGRVDRHVAPGELRLERGHVSNEYSVRPNPADPPALRGWRVEQTSADGQHAERRLALVRPRHERRRPMPVAAARLDTARRPTSRRLHVMPAGRYTTTLELGEAHYLRSEPSWRDAGAPAATVEVSVAEGALTVAVDVRLGRAPVFAPPGAANALDNERADVNSDGLQLLVGPTAPAGTVASWLLVPELPPPSVRQTPTSPDARTVPLDVQWTPTPDGWRVVCRVPLAALSPYGDVIWLDLAVNEKPPGRDRRRGQLLLSAGEPGEPAPAFVYLRGDRLDVSRALRFELPPAARAR